LRTFLTDAHTLATVTTPKDRRPIVKRLSSADLGRAWTEHAAEFVAWARKLGHDSYWQFHRELFLPLIPSPGHRTLDLGCGEGRVSRDLKSMGHHVVGSDVSSTMLAAAYQVDPSIEIVLADAAALPFVDGSFDLVVAFMSFQDIDGIHRAMGEAARVLERGGRLCAAIVHPLNSAGSFESEASDSPFVISGSYLEPSYYSYNVIRDGLEMTFVSAHRPLSVYADSLADAGLLIERLGEPAPPEHATETGRSTRVPLFLHIRALKP
jgi:SAM-dependent methyltransferase